MRTVSILEKNKMRQDNTKIAIFKGSKIRRLIYRNEWWFSIVDVVQVLTEQSDNHTARKYWNKLAQRLREEGSEVVTNCHRLKLEAQDGKMRETDCVNHFTREKKATPDTARLAQNNFLIRCALSFKNNISASITKKTATLFIASTIPTLAPFL